MLGPSYVFLTRKDRSILELIYAITNLTAFAFFMIRAINAYANFYDTDILSTHWFNVFTYVMLFAYTTVTNVGFILLSKERTDVVLLEAATIDLLTQVNNRQTFLEKSFACIDKAKETKQPVSLLMFDIDNFKWVNDTYGHMAGDAVLREIAALVSQGLAGCETIGRFGGDEFAILMPGADEEKSAARADMMERLVKDYSFTSQGLKLRISIGVVTIVPDRTVNFDTFYRLADLGLYDAKNTEKGTWKRALYLPGTET